MTVGGTVMSLKVTVMLTITVTVMLTIMVTVLLTLTSEVAQVYLVTLDVPPLGGHDHIGELLLAEQAAEHPEQPRHSGTQQPWQPIGSRTRRLLFCISYLSKVTLC